MEYRKIRVSRDEGVAIVALDAPECLNAIDPRMAAELVDVFGQSGSFRAILVTGVGKAFSSGADLRPGAAAGENGEYAGDASAALDAVFNPMVIAMRDSACPIITAVNGPAAGIGCSVALMGDIILAAQSAYFLQAFRNVGLVPDGGSTYLLPRLIGKARAMEMMLMGDRIPADTALAWGLVNRVVPDESLLAEGLSVARSLAAGPASLSLIRRAVWASLDADWSGQLAHEREAARAAVQSEDHQEGVRAFVEKRLPVFTGT